MYLELAQLTHDFIEVIGEIEEAEGELSPELEKRYDKLLKDVASNTDKFAEVIKYLEHLQAQENEKKAIHEAKAKSLKNKIKTLKNQAVEMIQNGVEFVGDTYSVKMGTRITPKIYYTNYNEVPETFLTLEPKVDMKGWLKAVKNKAIEKPKGYRQGVTNYLIIRG